MNHDRIEPYVGPSAFKREDAWRFFGRSREAEKLLALISSTRITLVYGPSGAGKTSLLNARIIPALENKKRRHVFPVARVGGEISEELEPQNVYVFNTLSYLTEPYQDNESLATLTQKSLAEFFVGRREEGPANEQRWVLFFDQFEELFTTHPDRRADREVFFQQIQGALGEDPLLSIVFLMREDYLAEIDRYAPLVPGHLRTRFRIERLRYGPALEAVRQPAKEAGRPFEDQVAEALIDDLRQERSEGSPGTVTGEYIEPVQLQVVCFQLWKNLKSHPGTVITDAQRRIHGDVDRALESFYERTLKDVARRSKTSETSIRRFFTRSLITPAGKRSQVSREPEGTGGVPNRVIDLLLAEHLIRREEVRGGTWYELVHDRFIKPIRASNRHVFSRTRRRRAVAVAIAVVLAVIFGLRWKFRQDRALHLARADEMSQLALDTLKDQPPRSLWLALQAAQVVYPVDRRLTARSRRALRLALPASHARFLGSLPTGDVAQLTFDGPGTRLSVLDPAGTLSVWDVDAGQQLRTLGSDEKPIQVATISSDGARLATVETPGTFTLWDVDTQAEPSRFVFDADPLELLFSTDGSYLAANDFDGTLSLWDTTTGRKVFGSEPDDVIIDTVFRPGGARFATADESGTIQIWLPEETEPLLTLAGDREPIVAFSADAHSLVSVGAGGAVLLWDYDIEGPPWPQTLETADLPAGAPTLEISLDPAGRRVTLVTTYGTVRTWDFETRAAAEILRGNDARLAVAAFSRDGRRLALSNALGQTEVWELIFDEVPRILSGHTAQVNAIALGPRGRLLASGSDDESAKIWDLESGQLLATLLGPDKPVNAVAISPDGRRLATAGDDHTARIWDVESDRLELTLIGHSSIVAAVAWSPDGASIATGSTDATARLWNVSDGGLRRELPHPGESVRAVAFSPDGALLATAGGAKDTGRVRLWELGSGRQIALFTDHSDLVDAVAFSPCGELLATGSDDKTVRLWDVGSAEPRRTLAGHAGTVTAVAFAPDDARLASSDVNGTVHLWRVESGDLDFTIPGPSPIWDLAFTRDGEHLLTASSDARIRLEPLAVEDLIRLAEERTGAEPVLEVEN